MSARRGAVAGLAALVMAALPAAPARGADPVADQREKMRAVEARIESLQRRLGGLLQEIQALDRDMQAVHSRLGSSYLRLIELEAEAADARRTFNARARDAYMNNGVWWARFLLGAESLGQFLSRYRMIGDTMNADADSYRRLSGAAETLRAEREIVDLDKQELVQTSARMSALRSEFQSALASEMSALEGARTELARLEAQRRARLEAQRRARLEAERRRTFGTVSPAVEARRAARQILLDAKLAALLDWYAPGSGAEPFMPPKLRSTGIVSTGLSSWYGPGFDGLRASSGATYRQTQLTAASLVLPFGTLLKVTYRDRSVVVVITDRGPYIAGRVLDLSAAAAEAIGLTGVKEVRMEILVPTEPAPPFP